MDMKQLHESVMHDDHTKHNYFYKYLFLQIFIYPADTKVCAKHWTFTRYLPVYSQRKSFQAKYYIASKA